MELMGHHWQCGNWLVVHLQLYCIQWSRWHTVRHCSVTLNAFCYY